MGLSIDRRAFEYTLQRYNDDNIRSLICFACARIQLDTGGPRSHIRFYHGGWLFNLPKGSLTKNFSKARFEERYQRPGSPLAWRGNGSRAPDFTHWQVSLHEDVISKARAQMWSDSRSDDMAQGAKEKAPEGENENMRRALPKKREEVFRSAEELVLLNGTNLLCCPEDHRCRRGCASHRSLCSVCEIPICKDCQRALVENRIGEMVLCNDNWYGYVDPFMYANGVTWMEKNMRQPILDRHDACKHR